jgi:hypothetical protein
MSSSTAGEPTCSGRVGDSLSPDATHPISEFGLHADSFDVAHGLANLVANQFVARALTVQQAAEALLVSPDEIHAAIASGQLQATPAIRPRDQIKIGVLDLAEFARSQGSTATAKAATSRTSSSGLDLAEILARWRDQGVFSEPADSDGDSLVPRRPPQ